MGHDVKKDVQAYIAVFVGLAILTVVTVAAAYLKVITLVAFVIGLTIALIKGSLVALIFMHLKAERKMIYWSLLLTFVFFAVLIALPICAYLDHIGTRT